MKTVNYSRKKILKNGLLFTVVFKSKSTLLYSSAVVTTTVSMR